MRIRHIINPVSIGPSSDLYIAQPITFASLLAARDLAREQSIDVDLCFTCYPEDLTAAPEGFRNAGLLERSILDVATMHRPRKLPLIQDIVHKALQEPAVDLLVYTNVDIAVQPEFYVELQRIVTKGYDAFTINRRTLPKHYDSPEQLPLMYQDPGEKHPGHDCFIFKPDAAQSYDLGTGCIGANWIGRILLVNLMAKARRFRIFDNKRLTFHIGDDRSWKASAFNDYDTHNEHELVRILESLLPSETVFHGADLRKIFLFHRDRLHSQCIIKENTFSQPFPCAPEKILPRSFKGSTEWIHPVLLDQSPIFVVGHPRSGTTLLQSKLMTQKGIVSLPETHFFSIVRNHLNVKNDRVEAASLDAAFDTLRRRFPLSLQTESTLRTIAVTGDLSPKMLFEAIVTDGLLSHYDVASITSSHFLEKTPDHVERLDIIFRFYPRARIVNIVRHPEKAIFSRRRHFAGESDWPIQDHVLRWRASVIAAERYANDDRLMTIRLEDLVSDEVAVMAEVCRFAGIKFDARQLCRASEMADKIALPWEHWKSGNKQKLSADIARRNSRQLNETERKVLHCIAGEQMKNWGYEITFTPKSHPDDRTSSIAVFSHLPSHPQTHGNSKRIHAVCQSLKEQGFRVNFFYYLVHPNLPVDFPKMLEAWDDVMVVARHTPLPRNADGYYAIDDALEEGLAERFAAYCEERNAGTALVNYVFYSGVFAQLHENVTKIIDTHDRFTDRHLKLKAAGVAPDLWWFSFPQHEEALGLSRADVVLAIQEEEARFFSRITSRRVEVLPHMELPHPHTRQASIPFCTAGFLGSDNPVNVEAAKRLIAFYEQSQRDASLPELILAGMVCNKLSVDHPKVTTLGMIDTVDEFYDLVDVVIVPLEFGTGLKIKAVEALAHGKPLVTTAHGSIGLATDHPLLNLRNIEEVVQALAELSQPGSEERCIQLTTHCIQLFKAYHIKATSSIKTIFASDKTKIARMRKRVPNRVTGESTLELLAHAKDLIAKLAPPIVVSGRKALFIGHGFHQKTNSSQFFIDYLKKIFDLRLYWLMPHEVDPGYPETFIGDFDIVFFWQLMPVPQMTDYFSAERIVCIPMYDATGVYEGGGFEPKRWLPLKDHAFISFCRTFHQDIQQLGIRSFYLYYAPEVSSLPPITHHNQRKPKVLFLYRRSELPWSLVRQLFAPDDVESVHIHDSTDPNQTFMRPSDADIAAYHITISQWFENRADYNALLEHCDIFVAPRLFEGIGMSFLDAMARGLCVVAPNRPTMNEYIVHGKTGLLFEPTDPHHLDVSKWQQIGAAARQKIEQIRGKFETDLKILRLYLQSLNSSPTAQNPHAVSLSQSRSKTKKALLVFPHNPFLRRNGVQTRFLALLEYFASRGIDVDMLSHVNFVDEWQASNPEVKRLVRDLYLDDFTMSRSTGLAFPDTTSPLPDFTFTALKQRFDALLQTNTYDLVIIGYVHWAKLIKNIAGVVTLIMVEDCISQNMLERRGGPEKYNYEISLQDEGARIGTFDAAVFISAQEMQLFAPFCRNTRLFHIPHLIHIEKESALTPKFNDRTHDLLFVGSDNPFNTEAMKWFLTNVWPRLNSTISLAVVGKVCEELRSWPQLPHDNNLRLIGPVDDLSTIYQQARISICPMLQGTGLKIKVAEALAHGLPVVALPAGLIGMTASKDGCLEVHTPEEFARTIFTLLSAPAQWSIISGKARQTAANLFSIDTISRSLDRMLAIILQSKEKVKKICLIGSCVTRDAWRITEEDATSHKFFTRTSFITIMSSPIKIQDESIKLESKFQRNAIIEDSSREALKYIKRFQPEIIILDYIDDRYSILKKNNSYILNSNEFSKSGIREELFSDAIQIDRNSNECTVLWKKSLHEFCCFIEKNSPNTRFILHKAWFAEKSTDGITIEEYDNDKMFAIKTMNNILYNYYEETIKTLKNLLTIESSKKFLIANKNHLWGHAPIHYIDEYYIDIMKQLKNIIN